MEIITVNKNEYITVKQNTSKTQQLFSYYKNETCKKSSFNKYSFIEYLKSVNVSKRVTKQIESI